jgi:hypothetical protein
MGCLRLTCTIVLSASRNAGTFSHNSTSSRPVTSHRNVHTSTLILNAKYGIHLVDLSGSSSWLQNEFVRSTITLSLRSALPHRDRPGMPRIDAEGSESSRKSQRSKEEAAKQVLFERNRMIQFFAGFILSGWNKVLACGCYHIPWFIAQSGQYMIPTTSMPVFGSNSRGAEGLSW